MDSQRLYGHVGSGQWLLPSKKRLAMLRAAEKKKKARKEFWAAYALKHPPKGETH